MKYDLVIVGGGPAGLMATKTAAEDGLKVLWMSIQLSSMLRTVDDAKESCRSIGPTDWVILLV